MTFFPHLITITHSLFSFANAKNVIQFIKALEKKTVDEFRCLDLTEKKKASRSIHPETYKIDTNTRTQRHKISCSYDKRKLTKAFAVRSQ